MDVISACERAMTPVGLDTMVVDLVVSLSSNSTAVGSPAALMLLVFLLLVAWGHTDKKTVPGKFTSGLKLCIFS